MNPYENLPSTAFWKKAVAQQNVFDIKGLWDPKFDVDTRDPVATFGSCFAQHIGRSLNKKGYYWLIEESAPYGMKSKTAIEYGYGVFSARTGNMYTTSLLRQWVEWALGHRRVPDELWEQGGRAFDPFRPNIEPNGFKDAAEVKETQNHTLKSFRRCIEGSQVFVFTLGLTESWINRRYNYEYPICPGTFAGTFSADEHQFINQSYQVVYDNLAEAMRLMRCVNPNLRFLLTVSPVPLVATASGKHVLIATTYSKSVLRSVAGDLATRHEFVDYFPSYEIISSPPFRGTFFNANMRTVHPMGVQFVMSTFFSCLEKKFGTRPSGQASLAPKTKPDPDLVCEEEILEAFGR